MTDCERVYQLFQMYMADGVLTFYERYILALFGFFAGCFF